MPEHGGRLRRAAEKHGIPLADWLDLSTGIAPWPWALPEIPASAWLRLPEDDDGLEQAARLHYGAEHLLPLPGSQAAIQSLPRLRAPGRVGVLSPCYAEHAHGWKSAGHDLHELSDDRVDEHLDRLDVLVVVNPNNPTGRLLDPSTLLDWHARLQRRGGWLLVDEAFMDCMPGHSLLAVGCRPGLIVLRSFGKFFGLAGARLGFAFAEPRLLGELGEAIGPWPVSGPTRVIAQSVLADGDGRLLRRRELQAASQRLAELLARHGLAPQGGTALFRWLRSERSAAVAEHLAQRGILVRLFDNPPGLRFGLPPDESGWQRLQRALAELESHP